MPANPPVPNAPTAADVVQVPVPVPDAERAFEDGRFVDALPAWEAILSGDPGSARARGRVAACLIGLGRYREAVPILEALVGELPEQPLLLYRLAVARAGSAVAAGVAAGQAPARATRRAAPASSEGDLTRAALDALDGAAAAGLRLASGIDTEPAFAALRDGPRYAAIRARIARNDAPTATEAGFRSFDFWVGVWEARTADGVLQGHNRISRVLGGAAILERWTGATGFRGTSLNRYDRRAGTWRQTWVDDQGDVVEFTDGVASGGRLVFQAIDHDGGRRRLTFEDRGPDAFRQVSEQSPDGGATWTVEYDFRYRRLPDDDDSEAPPAGA
jgi:hypothetical protein